MLINPVFAGTLTSTVDRNNVRVNEVVNLNVQYDQQASKSQLNLDGLQADFDVLSVSPRSSSSTSLKNGKIRKEESTVWRIALAPKREGQLTIPAFSINGDQSKAIFINVQSNGSGNGSGNNSSAASDDPFSVFLSANTDTAYPGQQLLIEIEISAAANVAGLSGSPLEIDNADVEQLEQKSGQRLENGLIRNIVIISYAVFPKQAGTLSIPATTFTATQGGGRRSYFDSRQGQRVVARSVPLDIEVKPLDSSKSPWFPAQNVAIESRWSDDTSTMTVGEPITRTVVITALGQRAELIPPLNEYVSPDYKSYKDQAQLEDNKTDKGYAATRIESEAIVAAKEGSLVLPEQRISWWDVTNGQWQEAILPSETLKVAANTGIKRVQNIEPLAQQTYSQDITNQNNGSHWLWLIICGLLALLCLVQTVVILRLKGTLTSSEKKTTTGALTSVNQSEAKAWKTLQKALKSEDLNRIRQSILLWGKSFDASQPLKTLDALSQYSSDAQLNASLKDSFNQFERALYKQGSAFDVSALAQLMTQLRKQMASEKQTNQKGKAKLKSLY